MTSANENIEVDGMNVADEISEANEIHEVSEIDEASVGNKANEADETNGSDANGLTNTAIRKAPKKHCVFCGKELRKGYDQINYCDDCRWRMWARQQHENWQQFLR